MRSKLPILATATFGLAAAALLAAPDKEDPPAVRFDPVQKKIEGWTVHVDPAMLEGGKHAEAGAKALTMLANHLQRVEILVPEKSLAKLRQCEIWIEHNHPTLGNMQYHPGAGWLRDNGHDPRLVKMVHIPRASALLSRGQMLKHPAVVLHELAHSYHDQFLSFDHPGIIAAFDKAKESGSYDKVMLFTGQNVKHYAMTNHKEYFAEGTESFFYRNDFYPFVRAELKKHDPDLDKVLAEVWD
jgi:dipeptidyl-peptidase-4